MNPLAHKLGLHPSQPCMEVGGWACAHVRGLLNSKPSTRCEYGVDSCSQANPQTCQSQYPNVALWHTHPQRTWCTCPCRPSLSKLSKFNSTNDLPPMIPCFFNGLMKKKPPSHTVVAWPFQQSHPSGQFWRPLLIWWNTIWRHTLTPRTHTFGAISLSLSHVDVVADRDKETRLWQIAQ